MAITRSAKRALKKSAVRHQRNLKHKKQVKLVTKAFDRALSDKNEAEAKAQLKLAFKNLDKATKKYLHKNTANRLKSRLAKRLAKTIKK